MERDPSVWGKVEGKRLIDLGFHVDFISVERETWEFINQKNEVGYEYQGCMSHYNPKGHAVIASELAPQISEILGWDNSTLFNWCATQTKCVEYAAQTKAIIQHPWEYQAKKDEVELKKELNECALSDLDCIKAVKMKEHADNDDADDDHADDGDDDDGDQ